MCSSLAWKQAEVSDLSLVTGEPAADSKNYSGALRSVPITAAPAEWRLLMARCAPALRHLDFVHPICGTLGFTLCSLCELQTPE